MKRENLKTDAQCIQDYQDGRQSGFDMLYARYERPLFSYLLKMLHDRELTEDVYQQTWMKAVKALPSYREQQKFGSWLFGIAHHAAIDQIRKTRRQVNDDFASENLDLQPSETESPETAYLKKENMKQLDHALNQLPDNQRSVVLMRLKAGLSFKEIADIEKCSINTILGRMHYAVKNLRSALCT